MLDPWDRKIHSNRVIIREYDNYLGLFFEPVFVGRLSPLRDLIALIPDVIVASTHVQMNEDNKLSFIQFFLRIFLPIFHARFKINVTKYRIKIPFVTLYM